MILALDMSMRSTGICIIDSNNKLINFGVMKTNAQDFEYDENLILHICNRIVTIINYYPKIDTFVIEGLSLNSKSAKKDVIAGIYWGIRSIIKKYYPHILIGSIPVLSWRSWVVPAKEMKEVKKICRDPLKNAPLMKLPQDVYDAFMIYIVEKKMNITSMFDLTDAYWLAIYRNSLNTK